MTIPAWLQQLTEAATTTPASRFSRYLPPQDGSAHQSAVLVLFGETCGEADVLLTERADGLRSHAGQMSFPGGRVDPDDDGAVGAALREGAEETGLDPSGVDVLATLPTLWIPITNYAVTPVLAWWRRPSPVHPVDPAEVASVHRVRLDHLLDPANRLQVRHPSGHVGPAFRVGDLLIWGFTAGLLARLCELTGAERPWDHTRVEPLPAHALKGD